jgi:hypothetical protein
VGGVRTGHIPDRFREGDSVERGSLPSSISPFCADGWNYLQPGLGASGCEPIQLEG